MSYKIIGKYIKDLDFKIPNPKIFSLLSKNISDYKINIDIRSNQIKERVVQVETTLNLTPIRNDIEKISTKIIYATIIELNNGITDKNEIEKIILINVHPKFIPSLEKYLFLYLRAQDLKILKLVITLISKNFMILEKFNKNFF